MEQQPRLPLWFLPANMALIGAAFFLGVKLGGRRLTEIPEPQRSALDLVHHEILRSHVDAHDPARLVDGAIAGMLEGLNDPYSRYVPPRDVARYEEDNTGHYQGIGADFSVQGDEVVLWFPMAGSPAEQAGLQPGDVLLAVDDKPLADADARQRVAEFVRGPAGSDVRLQMRRDGAPITITVRRGDVQKPCVKWVHRVPDEPGLGYLHLTDFHPGSSKQLLDAVTTLQRGEPLRGLVVDLRGNGGGSFDECIAIARAFVSAGVIVTQQRRGAEVERHEARMEQCVHPTLPLVLLVNETSASASEVLAGALQDHHRAAIVGVRTHGKACVNTVYTWEGLDFRLKLTTGRYRTPNGRDIERHFGASSDGAQGGGIQPDVEVGVAKEQRFAIAAGLAQREVPTRWVPAFLAVAKARGLVAPAPPSATNDPQLAAALTALRARVGAK